MTNPFWALQASSRKIPHVNQVAVDLSKIDNAAMFQQAIIQLNQSDNVVIVSLSSSELGPVRL